MTALEQVMLVARTADGPRWAVSRPMIIVQAASRDVLLFCVTLRTLILCGCKAEEEGEKWLDIGRTPCWNLLD